MIALNSGVHFIVTLDWLQKSAAKGRPLPLDYKSKFIVRDAEKEKLWNFDMSRTLALSRGQEHRGVFAGLTFMVTPGVCGIRAPKDEDMEAIVRSGGGTLMSPCLFLPPDVLDCFVVSSIDVVNSLTQELVSRARGGRVHSIELIFLGVLRQELRPEEDILIRATDLGNKKPATKRVGAGKKK
jgi:hypothetical protein